MRDAKLTFSLSPSHADRGIEIIVSLKKKNASDVIIVIIIKNTVQVLPLYENI